MLTSRPRKLRKATAAGTAFLGVDFTVSSRL